MAKLIYKIEITAKIKVVTGLHIGGSDSVLDIGGIDNSIIKTKGDKPYIPGSSLKGKLRDLIARSKGYEDISRDADETKTLFSGNETDKKDKNGKTLIDKIGKPMKIKIPTRLIIRDSFVSGSFDIHEKAENVINRSTGVAMPRHTERVSPDSIFDMEMILDIYDVDKTNAIKLLDTLKLGFNLLENDYLGGSGSRGYGKVELNDFNLRFPFKGENPTPEIINYKFK